MNQKVPYLSRQMVYAFLIGLISGGVIIGLFDAYAKQPLFSDAFMGGDNTFYCVNPDDPNEVCVSPGGGGGPIGTSGQVNINSTIDSTRYPGGYVSPGGRR